jgi:hypothetical protein
VICRQLTGVLESGSTPVFFARVSWSDWLDELSARNIEGHIGIVTADCRRSIGTRFRLNSTASGEPVCVSGTHRGRTAAAMPSWPGPPAEDLAVVDTHRTPPYRASCNASHTDGRQRTSDPGFGGWDGAANTGNRQALTDLSSADNDGRSHYQEPESFQYAHFDSPVTK